MFRLVPSLSFAWFRFSLPFQFRLDRSMLIYSSCRYRTSERVHCNVSDKPHIVYSVSFQFIESQKESYPELDDATIIMQLNY